MIDEDSPMQLCARDAGVVNRENLAAKNAAYYEKNKDKIVASSKAYYAANKEKASAQKKAHYEANKDQVLAKRKEYYAANKEQVKARVKTYSEENKEHLATSAKAYREAHKEQQAERGKVHYEKNKEQVIARSKAYYEDNAEQVATRGKVYREDNKEKIVARSRAYREKNSPYKLPVFGSDEYRRRMSAAGQGISYEDWEGFSTKSIYCPKFNEACKESNREKYDRMCFLTGLPESKNGRKLSVHHVDMNKQQGCNGNRWRLVPLCIGWHSKTHNDLWEARIGYLLENVWI